MLYSCKQTPVNSEKGKAEAEDDSRSKSFSTLLYEDKVRYMYLRVCSFGLLD